jgi:hypothetical protein
VIIATLPETENNFEMTSPANFVLLAACLT